MKDKSAISIMLIALSALLLLSGCSGPPPIRTAPVVTSVPIYRIGPGDELQIYVVDHPNLSTTVPVRPDGRISIPLVQNMQAEGETPSELSANLEKALAQYVRNPDVTVIVRSFQSTYTSEVRIVGQAVKPQAIPYRAGMTLLDAMTQVGGLTPYAAGNSAELIRKYDGKDKVYRVRLGDLLNGDIHDNALLQPGDVIIIPQKLF
ncbi:XrtA/PEP-CTERM system exopolysaccharide export protein [Acidihalobacter aeolianus]|uniref:XrtA/PEP-CTERM system exopolysaccharide export protein n=1 Tax=Acidihalobacter aeolianus TaxID=2792603 RepID=UPI000AF842B2|nr:XrtA/PEP-CTERM system exopolysaccharide export protein [Acidihalobacter aeolianus]